MFNMALSRLPFSFFKTKSVLLNSLIGLVLITALGFGGYFAYQYYSLKNNIQDPAKQNIKEMEYIIEKVGKLVELPKGEAPLLATVNDVNKLKDKPFFKNAQNGDKALFYSKAQKAILYRPSTNKIIEIAPYIMPTATPATKDASSAAQIQTQKEPISISLLNGTTVSGLAKTAEQKLTSSVKNSVVVERKDAKKKDYSDTIIVDMKGIYSDTVKQIQTTLGGDILSTLPADEATPEGSILVILGSK